MIDLTNKKFGRYTVLENSGPNKHGSITWKCKCDCGVIKVVDGQCLRNGKTSSCGCKRNDELARSRTKIIKQQKDPNALSRTREYRIWMNIKYRCCNPSCSAYSIYGGRGIKICNRWKNSFKLFLEDMGKAPTNKHTVDRIDNDGHYMPSNCRWATRKQQANNRSNCVNIEHKGKTQTLSEWCAELQIDKTTVWSRIVKMGWSFEEALSIAPDKDKKPRRTRQIILL